MTIVTGIDLPATAPGGSVELFHDLYTASDAPLEKESWAFMLGPEHSSQGKPSLFDGTGKCIQGPPFRHYVNHLVDQLRQQAPTPDVLHLQHLVFGASPALSAAFPNTPSIALIHGTDLLYARASLTQHAVLTQISQRSRSVVAPTPGMADLLRRLVPTFPTERIVHVPWGVPDHLLASPPIRPAQRSPGPLRLLYAGRLTPEKGTADLLTACSEAGAELSVAAPTPPMEHGARYLGWFCRRALWSQFAHHDLLVVPSAKLEAFGLVAVEAQACGLPVLYREVPGLTDSLGDSAIGVSDMSTRTVSSALAWLSKDLRVLDQVREVGYRNAARFPLSATANALRDLTHQVS
ncbi:glycosyltransferase family 4 protein [Nocardiopsis flavescens]|uniref:glycosyltransferase family 4 protein n=1 Tax=Nocardiopsis flavescens TaxID=758803 RepID=UPI00365F6E53